jgi:diguanylate cyclase (GGDEF)-like protein/PAS domain S-box-containing protein
MFSDFLTTIAFELREISVDLERIVVNRIRTTSMSLFVGHFQDRKSRSSRMKVLSMAIADFETYDLGLASGFIEAAPDAVVIVDAAGVVIMVNAQIEILFGYPRESLLGQQVEMIIPDLLRILQQSDQSGHVIDTDSPKVKERTDLVGRRCDGVEVLVEVATGSFETKTGTLLTSFIRDVSERRRLEAQAAHFRSVVDSSQDAIIGEDLQGIVVSWNEGAKRLFGYSAYEAIGKSMSFLAPMHHEDELPNILRRVQTGEVIENYETMRTRKDGTQVNVSMTASPIRSVSGEVTGASTIARNNTERLRYQEQLIELSERDPLTGLRNRRRFERDITDQVGRAHRFGEHAVLMMIDLNGFKKINDMHGHKVGDQVLRAVAAALKGRLRDTDMVARIGGDEFAIIMPYARVDTIQTIVDGLHELIKGCSFEVVGSSKIQLTASIGLVEINQETRNEEDIIAEADRRMYKEKVNDPSRQPRAS